MEDYVTSWGKEGKLFFKYQEWDSEFFQVPSYILDVGGSSPVGLEESYNEVKRLMNTSLPDGFITAKIPYNWGGAFTSLLQDTGFRFILTELVLKLKIPGKIPSINDDLKIEIITSKSTRDFSALGKELNLSRFHQDRLISNVKADLLWKNFLKNYAITENKNVAVVAQKNGKIVGCVIIEFQNIDEKKCANFFIVSVDEASSGLGIGTQLMQHAIDYCLKKSDIMIVETQFNNIPAINFYLKNGFTELYQSRTIFHRL